MARAVANPAADNYGTNILGIAAEQTDYFTPQTLPTKTPDAAALLAARVYPNVIEFRPPYSLTPVKEFYPVERYKGNPSPDPSIPGMQMGAGEVHFYLDATSIPFWIKHLLQATTQTSTVFADQSLETGVDFAAGAGAAPALEPKDALDAITTAPIPPFGMTAARIKLENVGTSGKVSFSGKDHNGAPLNETKDAEATVTSDLYYSEVVIEFSEAQTGVDITADLSEVYEHKLSFVSEVSEGLSLEVREGNVDTPITYNGMLVSRGIISLEQVARFRAMVIANEAHPRQALHTPNTNDGDATTLGSAFNRLPFHAIPAPGMSWEIGGDNVPGDYRGTFRVASIGMAIDNRIAPPRTAYAETFFYPKPVRKMNREIQLQVAIDYSKEADFDRFVGGLTFESTLSAASKGYGDAYRAIRIKGNYSQIVNNPTRIAGDLAEVLQQIVTRMHIGTDPDGNDEAEFTVINTRSTI